MTTIKDESELTYKEKAREQYTKIGEVKCPAFNEKVVYNAKGFNHIFYKGSRSDRGFKDIQTRVRLLDRSKELLEKSGVVQEESSYQGKHKGKAKEFKFWGLEGVINDRRIRVVVRQVGQGKKHFWSVIPAWRKTRFGKVKNCKNNLAKL